MWTMNAQQQHIADRIVELRAFLDAHGHLPQRRSTDQAEKHLADWAYRHMRAMKPWPEAVDLIEGAGGYRQQSNRKSAPVRHQQLLEFTTAHGRLPKRNAADPAEDRLYYWAREQYLHTKHPDPKTLALLTTYGGYPRAETTRGLVDRTEELRAFVTEHGRMPIGAAGDRTDETRLYQWVAYHSRRGTLPSDTQALVARYGGAQHTTIRRIAELENFVATHSRTPSPSGESAEKSLAEWLIDYRKNEHVDPRVTGIIEFYTRRGQHQKAQPLVAELHEFIAKHHHFPRHNGNIDGEPRLYDRAYTNTNTKHPHPAIREMARRHGMSWKTLHRSHPGEGNRPRLSRKLPARTAVAAAS